MAEIVNISAGLRATVGTQDFTFSGFGTPKAAKFFITAATANGVPVTHALYGIGCTDGVRQFGASFRSRSGSVTPSNGNGRRSTSTDCFLMTDTNGNSIIKAQFVSWITDGVRINVSLTDGTQYIVTCVLYGGTGILDARVDLFNAASVIDTYTDVATGFPTSFVETFVPGASGFINSNSAHMAQCMGLCQNDGTNPPPQLNIAHLVVQSSNPQSLRVFVESGKAAREPNGNTQIELKDFTASGFRAYTRSNPVVVTVGYLAIRLHADLSCKLLQLNSPTSTGAQQFTGVGFSSQHAILIMSSTTLLNSSDVTANAEVFASSVLSKNVQHCHAISADDGVTTTVSQTIRTNKAINLRKRNATFYEATFSNFTADGVELDFTTVQPTISRWIGLFIQEQSPVLGSSVNGKCSTSGSLTTSIPLSQSLSGKASLVGSLTTFLTMQALSDCTASSSAALSTTSLMHANAVCRVSTSLAGGDFYTSAACGVASIANLLIGFSWTDVGFNFRKTSGYVADAQSEAAVLGHFYPRDYTVNGQRVQAGWLGSGPTLIEDRDNALDRRLAGVNGKLNDGSQVFFRITLSQFGNWLISVALGDAGLAHGYQYIRFYDNATPFLTLIRVGGTAEDEWMAIDGNVYSVASWVADGSNITVARGFSDPGGAFGILIVEIGSPDVQAGSTTIAHLRVLISPNQGALLFSEASGLCSTFSLIEVPFSAAGAGSCSTSARFGVEILSQSQAYVSTLADLFTGITVSSVSSGKCSVASALTTVIYTLQTRSGGACQIRRRDVGLFATWNMQFEADLYNFYVTVATQPDGVPFIGMIPLLRANILLQSNDLQALPWGKDGCFIHRNAATHSSTTDGFEIVESISTGLHRIYQSISFVAASDYSFSVYLRKGSARYVRLRLIGPNAISYSAEFDLEGGVVTPGSSNAYPGTTAIMQVVENGYRCAVSGVVPVGAGFIIVELVNSSHESIYAGYGVNGAYLWNPQLTLGVSPIRYVGTWSLQRVGHFAAFTAGQTYHTRVYAIDKSSNLSLSSTEVPFTIPVELVTNINGAATAIGKTSTLATLHIGGPLFLVSSSNVKATSISGLLTVIHYAGVSAGQCVVVGALQPSPAALLQVSPAGKCSVSASLFVGIGFVGQPSCRCFTIANLTGTSASVGLLQDNVNERFEERGMERGIFDGGG